MPNAALYSLCVLIWGTTWYALTFQVGTVPAELSVVYRFALAAALLLGFAAIRRGRLRFSAREHGRMALQGLLNIALTYVLVYLSAAYLTSGLIAVANSNVVFLSILFGTLFFAQPLRGRVVLGAVTGAIGMILIFAPDLVGLDRSRDTMIGLALVLASTATTALGILLSGSNSRAGIPVLQSTGFAMAYGAGAVALYAALKGEAPVFDTGAAYVISLLYLAVFGSVIAFLSFFTLANRIGTDRASYASVLFPVVALTISTLLEGYRWTGLSLAGVGLVLIGNLIVIARLPRTRTRPVQVAPT